MAMNWRGDAVITRLRKACRFGVNKTMGQCALVAKNEHPWHNRTGTAERSIRIAAPAVTSGDGHTVGIWGSVAVGYFAGLEQGNPAHTITVRRKKALAFEVGGKSVFARSVVHPGNKPMPVLVPTANKIYPKLAANIGEGWGRGMAGR
jgi:hypothetical protein